MKSLVVLLATALLLPVHAALAQVAAVVEGERPRLGEQVEGRVLAHLVEQRG